MEASQWCFERSRKVNLFKHFIEKLKFKMYVVCILVYKDLLAVTSSSTEVLLTVKFEKPPKLNFQDFLKLTLEFVQLSADEEAAPESNIV